MRKDLFTEVFSHVVYFWVSERESLQNVATTLLSRLFGTSAMCDLLDCSILFG